MTGKERVRAALRRENPDRVPVFMWFHPETSRRIGKLLDIPPGFVSLAMGDDIRQTWVNNNYAMEGIIHERDGEKHEDEWGIEWTRVLGFNQITHYPLKDASPEEVLAYRFPEDRISKLMDLMLPLLRESRGYFVGCDVSPCVFEMYWRLRGMEKTLSELVLDRELSYSMLGRCADFSVLLSNAAINTFELDWLWTGDDVASQQSLFLSPAAWRELVKPHLKRIFDVGKAHNLPVAYHSCGAVYPIIEDLIEIGMDVLNPVQSNCPGMNPFDLKWEFGKHLTFMGGVDTQHVLPNGSAAEVREYTDRLISGMTSDGGGYILAASHTIPPETPDDNIFAMYEAAGITREEIFDTAAAIRSGRGGYR